jgi:hypothetical protein
VLGSDVFSDLAVVRLPSDRTYPVATLGDSEALEAGEPILSFSLSFRHEREREAWVGLGESDSRLAGY